MFSSQGSLHQIVRYKETSVLVNIPHEAFPSGDPEKYLTSVDCVFAGNAGDVIEIQFPLFLRSHENIGHIQIISKIPVYKKMPGACNTVASLISAGGIRKTQDCSHGNREEAILYLHPSLKKDTKSSSLIFQADRSSVFLQSSV